MSREFFNNLPDTSTPLNAQRMNGFLNGNEAMGSIVVDDISCKNLFNKIWKKGWIRYNDGAIMNSGLNDFGYTDYIEVEPNTTYTINFHNATQLQDGGIMQYDSSKNLIGSGIAETETVMTFKTTATTKYLIFTFRQDSIDNIQLEKGSVATEYTPYKSLGYISGSNENGSWVKYDDGRMECWKEQIIVGANMEAKPITFPAEFSDNAITIICTNTFHNHKDIILACADKTVNGFNAFLTRNGDTITTDESFGYHALGRWK